MGGRRGTPWRPPTPLCRRVSTKAGQRLLSTPRGHGAGGRSPRTVRKGGGFGDPLGSLGRVLLSNCYPAWGETGTRGLEYPIAPSLLLTRVRSPPAGSAPHQWGSRGAAPRSCSPGGPGRRDKDSRLPLPQAALHQSCSPLRPPVCPQHCPLLWNKAVCETRVSACLCCPHRDPRLCQRRAGSRDMPG